ncbi:MAG: hypothetical protein ACP5U0_09820 [Caldisphaera sp.]
MKWDYMAYYPIGIPFASYNTDLIILFIGFLFLEATYKINKVKVNKNIFFDEKTSEIEKTLWFFVIGLLIYSLLLPFILLITYMISIINPNWSISFFLMKPDILPLYFNLDRLSAFSGLATPLLISFFLAFLLLALIPSYFLQNKEYQFNSARKWIASIDMIYYLLFFLAFIPFILLTRYFWYEALFMFLFSVLFIYFINKKIENNLVILIAATVIFLFLSVFFILFYPLTLQFSILNATLLTNNYYIISGNPESISIYNGFAYQNLTAYNITNLRINFSPYYNFAYFIIKNNSTYVPRQDINRYTNNFYLPGTLFLPEYPCGNNPVAVCKEANLTLYNSTIYYLLISGLKPRNNTTIFVPLKFGPLRYNTLNRIINISQITQSCQNNLCEINFSIYAKRIVEIDSLTIPIEPSYSLDSAIVTINSMKSRCYPILNQIICNTPNGITTFIAQVYSSINTKALAFGVVTLSQGSKANVTIILNKSV